MEIRDLQEEEIASFLAFYNASYPERGGVGNRFEAELRNPLLAGERALPGVLAWDGGEVVGQLLIQPGEHCWQGKTARCYVGYDFYVCESYRGAGLGGLLALDAIRRFCPYFTVGVSSMTREMLLALDLAVVGELDKYVWLRKSLETAWSVARGLAGRGPAHWRGRPFPDQLSPSLGAFRQDVTPQFGEGAPDAADDVLAFARNAEFLRWRFRDRAIGYAVFAAADQASIFFAARLCAWHGLRLLSLVDYRYPLGQPRIFEEIVGSAKELAEAVGADGVITMSSYQEVDDSLRGSGFSKIGKPTLFMAPPKYSPGPERIAARKAVLATMADGDTDLLFAGVRS